MINWPESPYLHEELIAVGTVYYRAASAPRRFAAAADRLATDDSAWLEPCTEVPQRLSPAAISTPVQAPLQGHEQLGWPSGLLINPGERVRQALHT